MLGIILPPKKFFFFFVLFLFVFAFFFFFFAFLFCFYFLLCSVLFYTHTHKVTSNLFAVINMINGYLFTIFRSHQFYDKIKDRLFGYVRFPKQHNNCRTIFSIERDANKFYMFIFCYTNNKCHISFPHIMVLLLKVVQMLFGITDLDRYKETYQKFNVTHVNTCDLSRGMSRMSRKLILSYRLKKVT